VIGVVETPLSLVVTEAGFGVWRQRIVRRHDGGAEIEEEIAT